LSTFISTIFRTSFSNTPFRFSDVSIADFCYF
jgi:hypothetical protein